MTLRKAFLPQRGILEIQGEDRASLLQGLITNDITLVTPARTLYGLLLTPQGRFLYDFFISEEKDSYFLETDSARLLALQQKLALYKLRSRVTFIPRPDLKVFALWGETDHFPQEIPYEVGATCGQVFLDPRLKALGLRGRGDFSLLETQKSSLEDYTLHRLKLGVPETTEDLIPEKSIPLESGLDELNAISWTKGCYIGQELTSRTKHLGLVRKRLLPVTFHTPLPLKDTEIRQGGKSVGDMRSHFGLHGIALLRLEALNNPEALICGTTPLTPVIPPWMALDVSEA